MSSRLDPNNSPIEAITVMSEGNPGAVTVLCRLMKENSVIDPDDWAGPWGPIMSLDTHKIYGSNIWVLFKECCGQSVVGMLAVLRAVQLGLMPESEMKAAIGNGQGTRLDTELILARVQDRLPDFGATPAVAGE